LGDSVPSGLPDFGPSFVHISGTVNADFSATLSVGGNTYHFGPAANPIAAVPGTNLVLSNSSCGGGPFFFDNLSISSQSQQKLLLTLIDIAVPPSLAGTPGSVTALASITGANSTPVPNMTVNFSSAPSDLTQGGHLHMNLAAAPIGSFSNLINGQRSQKCTTDSTGTCALLYTTPVVSGLYEIKVTSAADLSLTDSKHLLVAIPNLTSLSSGLGYTTDPPVGGQTTAHPSNHFGTLDLQLEIAAMAFDYRAKYPGAVLGINDMSLPLGGLFDLDRLWDNGTGHSLHRTGTSVDVNRSQATNGQTVGQNTLNSIAIKNCLLRVPEPESNNCSLRSPFTEYIHYEVVQCVP
jgi:hypothetical protein